METNTQSQVGWDGDRRVDTEPSSGLLLMFIDVDSMHCREATKSIAPSDASRCISGEDFAVAISDQFIKLIPTSSTLTEEHQRAAALGFEKKNHC